MSLPSLVRKKIAVLAALTAVALPTGAAVADEVPRPTLGEDAPPAWTHDPESPLGPARWGDLDPAWSACADGESQSPVAIAATRPAPLPLLRADYPVVPLVVENTGHVVEVAQASDGVGALTVGADSYDLVQWHVHAPSEHTLDGHRYDLEVHLVHRDAEGRLAVLAVLADGRPAHQVIRSGHRRADNALTLAATLATAPGTAGEERDSGLDASAEWLLPPGVERERDGSVTIRDYATYAGSLTTPPCTEGVRWFVLTATTDVFTRTVARLHSLVAAFPGYEGRDNNRPLQPLDERTVLHRES
jgi:carbonic anhydrase